MNLDFFLFKSVHVACVIASYTLFLIRGIWMLQDSPRLRQRWAKTVPHVVDTLLLASALTMAVMIRQYPFVSAWLTAKVLALVVYIGLGMIALRYGRSRRVRVAAWFAAQCVFFYIVAVALFRNPFPWMAG